jgi:hypothetical protein
MPADPNVVLPENLTRAQYEHLLEHEDQFRDEKGDSIVEYFSDLSDNPRYHDLYERVCDDLGLPRRESYSPKHRAD